MFKQYYLKYIKKLLIFTIFLLIIAALCMHLYPSIISPYFVYLLLGFLLITAVSHYIILQTDVKRMEFKPDSLQTKEEQMKALMAIERKFISQYMLVTTVKLLLFLTVLLVYALVNKADMLRFSLNFLALYLLYSAFEIVLIKRPLQKVKK